MLDKFKELIDIKNISEIEFKEIYGFTFVFKTHIFIINDKVSSLEIKPVALIYKENDEFYLAPLDVIDDINGIVKEFVEKNLT
ncbi:hypothetical protein [Methanobrevibacter sp.]